MNKRGLFKVCKRHRNFISLGACIGLGAISYGLASLAVNPNNYSEFANIALGVGGAVTGVWSGLSLMSLFLKDNLILMVIGDLLDDKEKNHSSMKNRSINIQANIEPIGAELEHIQESCTSFKKYH